MHAFIKTLWNDEAGFIVSAELVLISTMAVLAMVVGLSEVSVAVHRELGDVSDAFGVVNQGFRYQGLTGHDGATNGTNFSDGSDFCDTGNGMTSTAPTGEGS